MATINFKRLEALLESGQFYEDHGTNWVPLEILKLTEQVGVGGFLTLQQVATLVDVTPSTCAQYVRWLASQKLIHTEAKGQGGVVRISKLEPPNTNNKDLKGARYHQEPLANGFVSMPW